MALACMPKLVWPMVVVVIQTRDGCIWQHREFFLMGFSPVAWSTIDFASVLMFTPYSQAPGSFIANPVDFKVVLPQTLYESALVDAKEKMLERLGALRMNLHDWSAVKHDWEFAWTGSFAIRGGIEAGIRRNKPMKSKWTLPIHNRKGLEGVEARLGSRSAKECSAQVAINLI
jgi:hypothetical protein